MSKMSIHLKRARLIVGLPEFERECRCEMFGGHKTKRYNIPGTMEAGNYQMKWRTVNDLMQRGNFHYYQG